MQSYRLSLNRSRISNCLSSSRLKTISFLGRQVSSTTSVNFFANDRVPPVIRTERSVKLIISRQTSLLSVTPRYACIINGPIELGVYVRMGFDYLNKLRTKRVSDFDRRVVLAEEADREINLKQQTIFFFYWLSFFKTPSVRNEKGAPSPVQFCQKDRL